MRILRGTLKVGVCAGWGIHANPRAGIADFYKIRLLYKFGVITEEEYVVEINEELTAYYTNPSINMTMTEALQSKDGIIATTPYSRGNIFLTMTDAKIRHASRGRRSIDDIVFALLDRKRKLQHYRLEEYLSLIKEELGAEGVRDFYSMLDGRLILPRKDLISGYELVRRDQEQIELGFHFDSLNARVISGVVKGSRAEQAGIRDGDVILEMSPLYLAAEVFQGHIDIEVQRSEVTHHFRWWPRTWIKVQSYQLIPLQEDEL